MKFSQHSARSIPLLPVLIGGLLLVISTLTRLGLAAYTGTELVPPGLWPGLFAKGLWFDIAVASALLAPVFLYEALLPNRLRRTRIHHVLRLIWLWGSAALLLFGAVSEFTFWMEFSTRFNFIALDYLIYTHEVIGNIRESYPVGWIFAGIGVLAAAIVWLLSKWIRVADQAPLSRAQRIWLAVTAIVFPVLCLKLATIDQMEERGNAYATELSGNGLFTLAATMRRNELDYDKFYRTMPQETANAILQKLDVTRTPLAEPLKRQAENYPASDQIPFTRRPRNVVLISVESLSASFLGAYGSAKGLTPRLDELARDGLKFEQVFATDTRTVRGLEALSLGTPPIPGQAIVRRPGNDHLTTIGQLLGRQGFRLSSFTADTVTSTT